MSNRSLGKIPGNNFQLYDPELTYFGWTPERKALFFELWFQENPRLSEPQIAAHLKVTHASVRAQAITLRLPRRGRHVYSWWRSEGREEGLRILREVVGLSASECAAALGTTKNAVIGKIDRLSIGGRSA